MAVVSLRRHATLSALSDEVLVIAIYTRGSGKAVRHGDVDAVQSVQKISRIVVQAYTRAGSDLTPFVATHPLQSSQKTSHLFLLSHQVLYSLNPLTGNAVTPYQVLRRRPRDHLSQQLLEPTAALQNAISLVRNHAAALHAASLAKYKTSKPRAPCQKAPKPAKPSPGAITNLQQTFTSDYHDAAVGQKRKAKETVSAAPRRNPKRG